MIVSVLWTDHPARKAQELEDSTETGDFDSKTEERHAVAA